MYLARTGQDRTPDTKQDRNKLLVILGVRASKIVHAAYEWFGIENMKADNKLRISSIFKHSYMVMHITLMNPADLSTSSL